MASWVATAQHAKHVLLADSNPSWVRPSWIWGMDGDGAFTRHAGYRVSVVGTPADVHTPGLAPAKKRAGVMDIKRADHMFFLGFFVLFLDSVGIASAVAASHWNNDSTCKVPWGLVPWRPGPLRSQVDSTSCLPCAPGNYSRAPGAARCQLCSPGRFASQLGTSSCSFCEAPISNMLGSCI